MGLRIATNVASINAQRMLRLTRGNLDSSLEKLSSGSRINKAADDAAGLAISENLKAQIRGIRQARRNSEDGISLIQVSEGGLNEISNILIRLRELSVQAASDTLGEKERQFTDLEFQNLSQEIERISQSANFNQIPLLNGQGGLLEIQVNTGNDPFKDRIMYDGSKMAASTESLGIVGLGVSTKAGAQGSLDVLDNAIVRVNGVRAELGALQNRLQSTINALAINDENLSAANSRVRDVDVAAETAELTKNNILVNSGITVLSQANQSASLALKLLNSAGG